MGGGHFGSDSHTHNISTTLSERPGGCFNADGFTEFRVTRSFAVKFAEGFYFFNREIETCEV